LIKEVNEKAYGSAVQRLRLALLWSFFTHDQCNHCAIARNLVLALILKGERVEVGVRLDYAESISPQAEQGKIAELRGKLAN
jgi:hypothetical protein